MEELTIEHLHPQSTLVNDWTETNVGQLGNLIFLDQKLNGSLKTKEISEKLSILEKAGYDIPTELQGVTEWTPTLSQSRTDNIAEISYNTIWRF